MKTSLAALQVLSVLLRILGSCDGLSKEDFPSSISLKAAVLTHAEPFAMRNEVTGEYSGLELDLLEAIKLFAAEDGVELRMELEEAPMYGYTLMFDRLSDNCNTTENPQPLEECGRYDLLIGDFYTNPDRHMRVDFTPPYLRTAVSALQYIFRDTSTKKSQVTTMEEASQANATVCVVNDSYMDAIAKQKFPNIPYHRCVDPDDCISQLKANKCPLFVDDELQLRYRMVQDPTLQVTQEDFNSQYITWPMRSDLDPVTLKLMKRWMYAAKSNATLDDLYNRYFSVNLCPLGYAGTDCDQPCHPQHGRSDRLGACLCDSMKWTGPDCSIEVLEDTNSIPASLVLIGYIMVGINYAAAFLCFAWLYYFRYSPQVQVAQPLFLSLVLVGCLISTFTIIPLAQENLTNQDSTPNDIWCMSIPWCYSVGFSITFGTLFAKIRRVYVLFKQTAGTRKISISWKETIAIIGGVLLLDVLVLAVWTIFDPLYWERTVLLMDKYGVPLESEGHCTGDHWAIFAGVIALLHFVLLLFATYLCYVARDIPTKFSEGRYLAIAMVSNIQIFVVGVPVLVILGSDPQTSFFVRSVIIWMNDLVVLSLIFGNLMYSLWQDQRNHIDGKDAVRVAVERYRSSRVPTNSEYEKPSRRETNTSYVDRTSRRSHVDRTSRRSQAPPSKRERAADSWAVMNSIVEDHDNKLQEEEEEEEEEKLPKPSGHSRKKVGFEPSIVTHKEPKKQRERPPDSWAAMNDCEGGSVDDTGSTSVLETMEQITEEEEISKSQLEIPSSTGCTMAACSKTCNTDACGKKKSRFLEPSKLPQAPDRFSYANSRIGRIRSHHSLVESFDDENS